MTHRGRTVYDDDGGRLLQCVGEMEAREAARQAEHYRRILAHLFPDAGERELAVMVRVELRREGY